MNPTAAHPATPPRRATGITNFNPDQTSVTAQTFTSTSPVPSPRSRTTLSVRSVVTPELFFGQQIQSIPAGASARAADNSSTLNTVSDLAKIKMKSRFPLATLCRRHFASAFRSSVFTSFGTCSNATRNSSLTPSFLASGVPEYPAISEDSSRSQSEALLNWQLGTGYRLLLWRVIPLPCPHLQPPFL